MWHLVKGLWEIHDDHICLSVTPGSKLSPGYYPCHERTEPVGFHKTFDYGSRAGSQQEYFKGDIADYHMLKGLATDAS